VSQKSLNDEERGGNCLLVPERSYGPVGGPKPDPNFVFQVLGVSHLFYSTADFCERPTSIKLL